MDNQFMTAKDVAQHFFGGIIGYKRVLELTRNKGLPAVKMGRTYIYRWDDVDRWAQLNFSTPTWAKTRAYKA